MASKKDSRLRRAKKTRINIRDHGAHRLTVHRTSRHIYAQVISPEGNVVIATASTLQKDVSSSLKYTGNTDAAAQVGKAIAEKSSAAGVKKVAFDRSGFTYHGRVKALADSARENGLEF